MKRGTAASGREAGSENVQRQAKRSRWDGKRGKTVSIVPQTVPGVLQLEETVRGHSARARSHQNAAFFRKYGLLAFFFSCVGGAGLNGLLRVFN